MKTGSAERESRFSFFAVSIKKNRIKGSRYPLIRFFFIERAAKRTIRFRKVSIFTIKPQEKLTLLRFSYGLTNDLTAYIISLSRFICILLKSIEECTYFSKVILTLECPSISLKDLISILFSMHFVAKVWRSA